MQVRIMTESGNLPKYQTEGASGMDLRSTVEHVLYPGAWTPIPTGVFVEIPAGHEMQVRPRSGLAATHGVTVLNAPGTIDADYRGEIKVILINHGQNPFTIKVGERIAQLVLAKVERAEWIVADGLNETQRGAGGLGSTGV
jgi:dUTP pyrophosphatase